MLTIGLVLVLIPNISGTVNFFRTKPNSYGFWVITLNIIMLIICYTEVYGGTGLIVNQRFVQKPEFIDRLYFSIITFTTLGFGDISPGNTTGKIAAASEALVGYIVMALLISSFLRLMATLES